MNKFWQKSTGRYLSRMPGKQHICEIYIKELSERWLRINKSSSPWMSKGVIGIYRNNKKLECAELY